jgi:hypothetical protein
MADWYAVHHVSLSDVNTSGLSLRREEKSPGPPSLVEFPDGLGSLSSGLSGPPGQHDFPLPSRDPIYSYVLHVAKERDPESSCIFKVRSWVTQTVASDIVDEYEIFAADQPAECGE